MYFKVLRVDIMVSFLALFEKPYCRYLISFLMISLESSVTLYLSLSSFENNSENLKTILLKAIFSSSRALIKFKN